MLNRIIIEGRLGADPEKRETPTGKILARLALPLFNPYQKENEPTEWVQAEVWNKPAEFIIKNGRKGHLVSLEGRLRNQKYTANDGSTKYRTFISVERLTLLEPRNRRENTGNGNSVNTPAQENLPVSSNAPANDPLIQSTQNGTNIELEIPAQNSSLDDMFKEFDQMMTDNK